ncbi:MAG: chitinase, partial [Verrucomicrobiae bacterium]
TGATEYYWHAADTVGIPRTRAEIFSYENFLKAVAILPGFCGSYESYPDPVLKPILEKNADLIARKLLATVFAHAVQETSDSGSGNTPAMQQKLKGVFANIVENKALVQLPEKDGVFGFAGPGAFFPLTLTGEPDHAGLPVAHSYAGRGIKQTSYPTNYANAGLFLFGDLRLLAYPELLEEPGVMGFLSGLVYAMLPKDGNPSIVEVMDGTYHRKLEEFSKTYGKDPGFEKFRETYDLEFPLTILLVNGGPECDGNRSINKIVVPKEMTEAQKDALRDTINNNTKIRIEAYNYFVQTEDLLGPVDAGSAPATTPAFVPESSDATVTLDGKTLPNGSHYIPKTTAVAANESYNLTGNLDSCLLLMTNTLNKTPGEEAITAGQVTHTVDTSGFTDAWVAKNCTDVWAGSYIQVGNTLYKAVQTGRAATKKADFLQAAPDITVIRPWETLFIRPLYYGPKWSGSDEMKVQASSGGNLPIFGGEKVKTLLEAASK